LKNSNGTPFNSSTKLPVTISNGAPNERLFQIFTGINMRKGVIENQIFYTVDVSSILFKTAFLQAFPKVRRCHCVIPNSAIPSKWAFVP